MNLARIGPALGHFIFEFVELTQYIDRDADIMLGKAMDAGGVMKEHVGIEDKGAQPGPPGSCCGSSGGTFFASRSILTRAEGGGAGKLLCRDEGRGSQRSVVVAIHRVHVGWVGGEKGRLKPHFEPSFLCPW